ncbi:MAG: sigma-70 family RNA polymerase sigma factor [Bacteroidota bacterium]|nr:sigma-70 family RNA polymerase sigma factor [Bacteroidota bacterium]
MLTKQLKLEDDDLIQIARTGDERAFTELVRRYEDMIYSFSYKVCRNKEKAEQTLQDTFINVYKNISSFRGDSKFSTWLYSIVTNNCMMKHRKRKLDDLWISYDESPTDGMEPSEYAAWDPSPAELLMDKELQEKMDAAILKLPQDYRVVFVLRDIEGRSAEETSKILKLSVPAVKSRLRRARVFLRDELNKYLTQ